MTSEDEIKDSQCVLLIRKRLERTYEECKATNDYGKLTMELFYLIPKRISYDYDLNDDRAGFLKFLKFLVDYNETVNEDR